MNDLLIFEGRSLNCFGDVAIISKVTVLKIIQQNIGPLGKSRETFPLEARTENEKITALASRELIKEDGRKIHFADCKLK